MIAGKSCGWHAGDEVARFLWVCSVPADVSCKPEQRLTREAAVSANLPPIRSNAPSIARATLCGAATCRWLLGRELQGDSILESEYILTKFILAQDDCPSPLIANYLRRLQQPDAMEQYRRKADLSGTVKAYFALKLMGFAGCSPHARRPRAHSSRAGGTVATPSPRFFFGLPRQISFEACPAFPEIVLLPRWFYFNLYHVSAWTRTMILRWDRHDLRYQRELPRRGIASCTSTRRRQSPGAPTTSPHSDRLEPIGSFASIGFSSSTSYRHSVAPAKAMPRRRNGCWTSRGSEGLGGSFHRCLHSPSCCVSSDIQTIIRA